MLILCPECNLQISDKAIDCPHCGYPMKEPDVNIKRRKTNKRRRLPNGFGQISEIKNRNLRNPFRAMVTVGKDVSGKPICKPLTPKSYFPTYNDAYAALVEYNRNPYDLDRSITVAELYEKWSEEHFKTISASSAQVIKSAWRYCSSVYGKKAVTIRTRHIKGCIENSCINTNNGIKYASPNTKVIIKMIFNLMLDYAVEYELADKNYSRDYMLPDDLIKEARTVKATHFPFSDDEINILWENIADNRIIEIILVQCYSGWRPREICTLKLADVDLDKMTFKGGSKTDAGKDRIVPIHSKIAPFVIENYNCSTEAGSDFLFNCYSGKNPMPLTYRLFEREFKKICSNLGLNTCHRLHDGRKHFVTMAKKYGVDEYAIKYIVGHSIADITEKVYTAREFEWLRAEIEKIK